VNKYTKGGENIFIYKRKQLLKMIVTIPQVVKDVINNMPTNKTTKNNAIKIYAALFSLRIRKNNFGYFSVPSEYLKSINTRYYKIIDIFEKEGLIQPYTRPTQDENDIFNVINKKYYDVNKGICMKYKFLIDVENGIEMNIDMITNRTLRWYSIIENSLIQNGFEPHITRDTYGRRVFHSAIKQYKTDFRGYYTIDSICSQPRLLFLKLKEMNVIDKDYNSIFENELDFYNEIQYKLNLEDRNAAKELFLYWLNGNGYVPNFSIHLLFPDVSKYLKSVKKSSGNKAIGNYKDSGSILQRIESKIWIDDLLNNIPCEWALPVHDCFIVKEKDADKVLSFCTTKYPELRFKKEMIK
jgi:hypothetical protein